MYTLCLIVARSKRLSRNHFAILKYVIARTHDLAAITALVIVVVLVSPLQGLHLSTILVALLANQLGGIAPDIDQPTAPFWRTVSFGRIFGPFATRLLGGHRFITHSLLGLFVIGFLVNWLLDIFSSQLCLTYKQNTSGGHS